MATGQRWLTSRRLLRAREMLETTDATIDRVAQLSGLGTSANLRALLARDVGLSPKAYRRAYRGEGSRPAPAR